MAGPLRLNRGMGSDSVRPLSTAQIAERLHTLTGWKVEGVCLTKTLTFEDFRSAWEALNRVADLAEEVGHHPDLTLSWGRLHIELTTHDSDGLTTRDFDLARAIDQRLASSAPGA